MYDEKKDILGYPPVGAFSSDFEEVSRNDQFVIRIILACDLIISFKC